jgi:hypothetical protein
MSPFFLGKITVCMFYVTCKIKEVYFTASHCGHRSPFANIKHKNKNEADMEVWRICASNRY